MTKKIDWTKPIRLNSCGNLWPRRFVVRDEIGDSEYPNIVAARSGLLFRYSDDGVAMGTQGGSQLENVPPAPVVTFKNVYVDTLGVAKKTLSEAVSIGKAVTERRVLCVLRIEEVGGKATKVEVAHTY